MAFSSSFSSNLLWCAKSCSSISKHRNSGELIHVSYKSASIQVQGCSIAASSESSDTAKLHQFGYWNGRCRAVCPGKTLIDDDEMVDEIRKLLLSNKEKDSIESLIFVDKIQRAGVSHHFEGDIKVILQRQYEATVYEQKYNTLHDISLSFRLLRQHGYDISPGVLKFFNGNDGKFNEELARDIRGVMELYEASQLGFDGEQELDEAASISTQILNQSLTDMNHDSSTLSYRLRYPYHKSMAGLTERYFLQNLVGMNGRDKALIRQLVEIDLETKRQVFQQEVLQVTKWWDELGFAKDLKLVRNQPLKWYIWSMACLIDDITLSSQRVELTKSIAFIYLIDDIFDLYGTPEELKIFAEAVTKWDYAAIDTLPDYMKMCYKSLLDTTNHTALRIYETHGRNPIASLKATWAGLCDAFCLENKWFTSGESPTADKYLENGIVSSGAHVVLVHLFFILGHEGRNIDDISEFVSSAATILRLWDDLGSAKDEHQDGKDGSYVEYYMKDHKGVTLGQARQQVVELIASAWKRLNKECFHLNYVSAMTFKKASLNLARMVPLMYDYDDNQKLPVLEDYVKFMLFNETVLN